MLVWLLLHVLIVFRKKGVLKNVPKFTGNYLFQGLPFNNSKDEEDFHKLPSWETIADHHVWVLAYYLLGHRSSYDECNLKHYIASIKSL